MGATFNRIKNWTTEVLSNTDLNAEIDNILNNLTPAGMDDYSSNAAAMRLSTDPGESGSESLATSLAGEIERLRFAIKEMKGSDVDYWYETAASSLGELATVIGGGLPGNRVVSCATSANSSQPLALDPDGTAATVVLDCTPTPFVYYVNGTQYTLSADVTLTGLGLAPSTNNTATVDMAILTSLGGDPQSSEWLGQFGTGITVDAMGSEITALVGKTAAFSISNGSATEYFIAYVESTTKLSRIWRGAFFNSSLAAVPSIPFTDNDTITLLRLTWVFAKTDGTLAVTYNPVTVAGAEPASPDTGDYWYDVGNETWKTFNSVAWVSANATLIGVTVQNTTGCIGARTFDIFKNYSGTNNINLQKESTSLISCHNTHAQISVYGTPINFGHSRPQWDMASDLDDGLTEAASTYYFFYIKESGATVISNKAPINRYDLNGFYHPSETWRCVGFMWNNASSNFDTTNPKSFRDQYDEKFIVGDYWLALSQTTLAAAVIPGSNNWALAGWSDRFKISQSGSVIAEWGIASGDYGDLTSLDLDPGIYLMQGNYNTGNNGAPTATVINIGISAYTGDDSSGLEVGTNLFSQYVTATSGETHHMTVPGFVMVIYQPTTVYLKYRAATAHANLELSGYSLSALRLDSLNDAKGL